MEPGATGAVPEATWYGVISFAVAVEHVGSTSVPGLAAKPIVDIDVIVTSETDVVRAIEQLAILGYEHPANEGIAGRDKPPLICVSGSMEKITDSD